MEQNKTTQQMLVAVPQISKQDFLKSLADTLGSYKWPDGSIECINPSETKLVYLRGYRFKGKAEATWTAKVNGNQKITVNNNEVNITDGTSYSDTIPSVDFDLLVINDNSDTPYWAKKFCNIGFEDSSFQPFSSIETTGGVVEGSDSTNPHSAWMKNGNQITDTFLLPLAQGMAENAGIAYMALNILPPKVIQQSMGMFKEMKFNSRDVTVSSRNSVAEEPVPVLIPFYVLEFQFEGKKYHMAMMADYRCLIKGQIPPVRDTDKTPEEVVEEEMPDKIKQVKLLKWGWLLAVILLFVVNLTVAVIALIAWGIAYWLVKKPINDRKKELEQQSASNSQKTAEFLRRQLTR